MNECAKKRRKKGGARESDERKIRRNSGLEYRTENNVLVPAKTPPNVNSCKNISHPQKLLEDLCKFDFYKQQNYLLGLNNCYGQCDDSQDSRRLATAVYTVPNGQGESVQVL